MQRKNWFWSSPSTALLVRYCYLTCYFTALTLIYLQGNLKQKIYEAFELLPQQQIIDGWKMPPDNDTTILNFCAYLEDITTLTVTRKTELDKSIDYMDAEGKFSKYRLD